MVRVSIFCAIILFIAFGAYAQERQAPQQQFIMVPQQGAAADAVTLNVIAATSPGKKDMTHKIEFPKNMSRDEAIDACAAELAAFLKHKFPDTVEIKARAATCIAPEEMGQPS